MNINSQPISLVRKNLMNTDSTVTNPEKLGLRLLSDSNELDTFTKSSENQENNVAFKGFNLNAIFQKAKLRTGALLLAGGLAVAPLMQSCNEPLINIDVQFWRLGVQDSYPVRLSRLTTLCRYTNCRRHSLVKT